MIRVYGRTTSSDVMKVLWFAAEIGVEVEECERSRMGADVVLSSHPQNIPAGKGCVLSGDNPEWRAISPFGMIPVLTHGNFHLAER